MYPIKFNNLYYPKVWGGRALKNFRDNLPQGNIGESWDIACHKNGIGVIDNGPLKGVTFKELIDRYGDKVVGKEIDIKVFPLLIKIIDARSKLSVQVHPGNEYAMKVEKQLGKTEAWYILDAKKGAQIILGTKDCDKTKLNDAIISGGLEPYLNKIEIVKGQFFYINSGLVHSICGGATILEIQQNSDITYRIYDYNRKRELHIERALDVIDLSLKSEPIDGVIKYEDGIKKKVLCSSKFFEVQKYSVLSKIKEKSDKDRFYLFTCVDGNGNIIYRQNIISITKGDSVLIPASLGEYYIEGRLTLLKSFVPIGQ